MRLSLVLPWADGPTRINNATMDSSKFTDPATGQVTLGYVITRFGEVALYAGAFLMFFWAAWGVFDYIRAEGNKEALAKARKRIQWAIAGFIILLMAFFIGDFVKNTVVGGYGSGRPLTPLIIPTPGP